MKRITIILLITLIIFGKVGVENVDKRPLIFKWSDGSTINPKFFAKNQPDNEEKLCLALDGNFDYFLDRKSCYFENNFICEIETTSTSCDEGWSFIGGNFCLKYFLDEPKNWTEAKSTCELCNGHLLTLNDNMFKLTRVQAFLKKNFKLNEYERYFWVGSSLTYDTEFRWLGNGQDQTIVNDEYFSPVESLPINDDQIVEGDYEENQNRRCVAIESTPAFHINSTQSVYLNRFSCYLELDYYCEYN